MHVFIELFYSVFIYIMCGFIYNGFRLPSMKDKFKDHSFCNRFEKQKKHMMTSEPLNRKKFIKFKYNSFIVNFFKKKNALAFINNQKDSLQAYETKTGVKTIQFSNGTGESPSWGSFVKINYTNYIKSGQTIRKIDSTFDRKLPFTFQHGSGEINLSLEETIHSMKPGGKKRIIIEVYSEKDILNIGPISPSSGIRQELSLFYKSKLLKDKLFLIYDIELIDIISKKIN